MISIAYINIDLFENVQYLFLYRYDKSQKHQYILGRLVYDDLTDTINLICSRTGNKVISNKHDTYSDTYAVHLPQVQEW